MEVVYEILYEVCVAKEDIPKLSSINKKRIKNDIQVKLTTRPELFGKPLRQSLKGYRKLRVGEYRVIFRIGGRKVKIFAILHRSTVYTKIKSRIET